MNDIHSNVTKVCKSASFRYSTFSQVQVVQRGEQLLVNTDWNKQSSRKRANKKRNKAQQYDLREPSDHFVSAPFRSKHVRIQVRVPVGVNVFELCSEVNNN